MSLYPQLLHSLASSSAHVQLCSLVSAEGRAALCSVLLGLPLCAELWLPHWTARCLVCLTLKRPSPGRFHIFMFWSRRYSPSSPKSSLSVASWKTAVCTADKSRQHQKGVPYENQCPNASWQVQRHPRARCSRPVWE